MGATTEKGSKKTESSEAKGRRINTTNLNYVRHHYEQALLSLERANTRANELAQNKGKSGEMAREIVEIGHNANAEVNRSIERTDSLLEEVKAFFG